MNTLPTIHMNGTSAKMLLEGYDDLDGALLAVQDAFGKVEFNGRDYYPQGPAAFESAREEWSEMRRQVDAIRKKVIAVMVHINTQSRERNQQPSRPKFRETWCSDCGRGFGPGDNGFSHCRNHQCAGCKFSLEHPDRIDHVRCNNKDSINFDGDVEAAGCCPLFERRPPDDVAQEVAT